jgi:signal peptidase I
VANPVRKLDRTRREALRFAADARALAARGRKRLDEKVRAAVDAACDEVVAAVQDGDADRLSAALRALDALWSEHLERLGKSPWREYAEVVLAAVLAALLLRTFVVEGYRIPSGSMAPTLLPGDHVLVSRLAYGVPIPFTRLRLGGSPPRRGDVIVFERPRTPGVDLVKRVVGLPGDIVEVRDQVLYVNGVPQPRTLVGALAYEDLVGEGGAPFVDTCRVFREALARGPLSSGDEQAPGQLEGRWQLAAAMGVANHEVLQCRPGRLAAREGPFQTVAPGHVFVMGDNRDRSADSRGAGGWQVPVEQIAGRAILVSFSWGAGGAPFGRGPRLDRLLRRVE